jgi:hypothetical protein
MKEDAPNFRNIWETCIMCKYFDAVRKRCDKYDFSVVKANTKVCDSWK